MQMAQSSLATSFRQTPYVSPVQQQNSFQEITSAVMAQKTPTPNGPPSLGTPTSSLKPVQLAVRSSPRIKSRTPPRNSSWTELFCANQSSQQFAARSSPRNLSMTPPRLSPLPNATKRCLDVSKETGPCCN